MSRSIPIRTASVLGAMMMGATAVALSTGGGASSHRDAPLIAQDPVADNTDVYAFVAPDAPNHVTLISNFIPLQEPASGPNFFNFGEDVLYEINVDNDGDASAELRYQFRFATTVKDGNTPLYNEGPITFSGGQYNNLNVQQSYTVTEVRNGVSTVLASNVLVPPANVGPRSTPNYAALAAAAVKTIDLPEGQMRVFAGPRDEAFPVDLGSIFDLGALRPLNGAHLIPLAAGAGVNATTGYNVHSIAIQVPKGRIIESEPVIGVHSTASRRQTTTRSASGAPVSSGDWVQISRLGMPLVNEVVVPLAAKDTFNGTPLSSGDSAFLPIVQNPRLGQLLPVLYPGAFAGCYPTAPRNDLVTIFLTGIPGINQPANVVPSEQLRLNTSTAPTPYLRQNPLGLLAGQADGFPNGRRLIDDVVDIELQAVAGATPVGQCAGKSPNNALGDGVSGNDRPFLATFPYLPHPHQGFEHQHDSGNVNVNVDPMSRVRQLDRLYRAYFNRQPDAAGLEFWLNDGRTIKQVSDFFAASAEFRTRYGVLGNEQFVELVYQNVLGRASETGGRQYWLGRLTGGMSRGDLMLNFSNSPEFISKG